MSRGNKEYSRVNAVSRNASHNWNQFLIGILFNSKNVKSILMKIIFRIIPKYQCLNVNQEECDQTAMTEQLIGMNHFN